uniref:Myosinlike protein putative n=1 Tax=Albugo laibachii Nc14 TaxID=890382 RepID=F0WHY8_9STRA|nr:myosinlike protein putative [Albugo laibachii Nc14]|eukprot:CCA20865.1 myosinlike protein putative [Albugo laibachii Nc14]
MQAEIDIDAPETFEQVRKHDPMKSSVSMDAYRPDALTSPLCNSPTRRPYYHATRSQTTHSLSKSAENFSTGNAQKQQFRGHSLSQRPSLAGSRVSGGLSPLLVAARNGDVMMLDSLLRTSGTDILRRDPLHGQTALHFGVLNNHIEIVRALIRPDIVCSILDIADKQRNTALHYAAAQSHVLTQMLVEAGAMVNVVNASNQTPLGVHISAIPQDDPSLSEILLLYGADPNAFFAKSRVLHIALNRQMIQIASRLVHHGARMDLKDEGKRRAFDKLDEASLPTILENIKYPPVWIPSKARKSCMQCSKHFGIIGSHRHHCRFCGRLVCSSCSKHEISSKLFLFQHNKPRGLMISEKVPPLPTSKSKQRVCNVCFTVLQRRKPRAQ